MEDHLRVLENMALIQDSMSARVTEDGVPPADRPGTDAPPQR
jgi:hypothetical protein